MTTTRRKPNLSPEKRAALAQRMRDNWKNPEWRARHKKAARAYHAKFKNDQAYLMQKISWGRDMAIDARRVIPFRAMIAERVKSPAFIEATREWAKRQWQDPAYVAKMKAAVKKISVEDRRRAQKACQDKIRGFSIPKRLEEDYRFLTRIKRFSAAEAGQMLGII